MKNPMSFIAISIAIIFLLSFLGYKCFVLNSELKRIKTDDETFALRFNLERLGEIKHDSLLIISYKVKADSAISVIKTIEEKQKVNKIYFKNKLNEIKNVNTFFKRSAYCDSIEQWLQSGEIAL